MSETGAMRDIKVEAILPHAPEIVWKALTTSEAIARWLMPNDFSLIMGKRFNFRTKPMGNWDGVVDCEVLEIVTNRKLAYSWVGGSKDNAQYGSKLDSIVTWTLTPVDGGTRLSMVHSGFRSPDNDFAFGLMSPGWGRIVESMGRLIGELAATE